MKFDPICRLLMETATKEWRELRDTCNSHVFPVISSPLHHFPGQAGIPDGINTVTGSVQFAVLLTSVALAFTINLFTGNVSFVVHLG